MADEEKKYIRVLLRDLKRTPFLKSFNVSRNDEYTTTADAGFEDLDLREDASKIQLYMQNDIITLNNDKFYKVVSREFQPCRPVMLILNVEEIEDYKYKH